MRKLQTKMMLVIGLGAIALMPGARADEWNQKTVVTFSGPVEVPGRILPAGTYVFKLANSSANRNIVQIFNKDENHVFGTFLAISDYRMKPSDKTIIRFAERPAGSPEAIKGWFYPGKNHGHEFVYPKTEAVALAKANNTPVPSVPVDVTLNITHPLVAMHVPEFMALNAAPLMAEEPTGEEVELAEAFMVEDAQASTPAAELPESLPNTATSLPAVGLVGLLSLGVAFALRFAGAKAR